MNLIKYFKCLTVVFICLNLMSCGRSSTLTANNLDNIKNQSDSDLNLPLIESSIDFKGNWSSGCNRDSEFSDSKTIELVYETNTTGYIVETTFNVESVNCLPSEFSSRRVMQFDSINLDVTTEPIDTLVGAQTLNVFLVTGEKLSFSIQAIQDVTPQPDSADKQIRIYMGAYFFGRELNFYKTATPQENQLAQYFYEAFFSQNWKSSNCFLMDESNSTDYKSYSLNFDFKNNNLNNEASLHQKIKVTQEPSATYGCLNRTGQAKPAIPITTQDTLLANLRPEVELSIVHFSTYYDSNYLSWRSNFVFKVHNLYTGNEATGMVKINNTKGKFWSFNIIENREQATISSNLDGLTDFYILHTSE